MADRRIAQPRPVGSGVSKLRGDMTSSVRRNLFQSQLTRRPTSNSSTSGETLRLDAEVPSESGDIVIRDKNGEIELGDPPTPPIDDPDDMALDASHENERERQRLAEAVKQHQIDQNSVPAQPEGMRRLCYILVPAVPHAANASCPRATRSRPCQSSRQSCRAGGGQLDVRARGDTTTPMKVVPFCHPSLHKPPVPTLYHAMSMCAPSDLI